MKQQFTRWMHRGGDGYAFGALILFSFLLTNCGDDSLTKETQDALLSIASASIEVGVSNQASSVAEKAFSVSNQFTKVALRDAQTLTTGDLGVFLAGVDYSSLTNVKYSYGAGWSSLSPVYLYSRDASVCAYYPYNEAITNAGSVPLASQLYRSDADFCYCSNQTVNSQSPNVALDLVHAYAKMTFNITREATYPGACGITQVGIENPAVLSTNDLNITNGVYGSTAATGMVAVSPADIPSISSGGTASVAVLMVPVVAITGDVLFSFKVDGETIAGALPASTNHLSTLAAGKNYQVAVTVTGQSFKVTNVAVVDWNEEVVTESPTMSTVPLLPVANCHIIAPSSSAAIRVNVKGNGDANAVAGTGLSVTHTAASVGVLWQTTPGLIALSNFDATNQKITITTSGSTGNAVVAAYDTDGTTILWSWHIWVMNYDPNTGANGAVYTYNSRTWMDRNLGATTTAPATLTTMGLLYQWGRKDPFPGGDSLQLVKNAYTSLPIYNASGTLLTEGSVSGGTGIQSYPVAEVNNLPNTILHPMWYYYSIANVNIGKDWYTVTDDRASQNDALWGGADPAGSPTAKTLFDPCPAGWRVPAWKNALSPWDGFDSTSFLWFNVADWTLSYGYVYTLASNTFYPSTGARDSDCGSFSFVGLRGGCWSGSISIESPQFGSFLNYFNTGEIYTNKSTNRGAGYPVRCVKE